MEKKKMKKLLKIVILAAAVVILLPFIVLGGIFLKISKERESVSIEEFERYTEENGYIFHDDEGIAQIEALGKGGAAEIEERVHVEFLECVSEKVARGYFNQFCLYAEERYKTDISSQFTMNLGKYGEYKIENGTFYVHAARIGNTVMHTAVMAEDKEAAEEFMEGLGYVD